MAKAAACKCKEVECEECPEWIFTLADLIMCMMGLFVILWCLKPGGAPSTANSPEANAELVKVLAGIREAFKYEPDPNSKDPVDLEILAQKLRMMDPRKDKGQGGQTTVKPKGAEGDQRLVTAIRNGRHALVGSRVPFDVGQASLAPEATKTLDEIVEQIKGHKNVFMVKGHADLSDFPDGATPQEKLDLSLRRAQAAADYLVSKGVDPETLRIIACSTFEPVAQRVYTPETRQQNRRAEVQSLDQLVEEYKDQPDPAKPLGQEAPAPAEPKHE